MQRKTWWGYEDEDRDQGGRGDHGSSRRSWPQGLLEHVLVCHLVWQRHHQALVLPHRLADDLIGLLVPGPTAAGHLSTGVEGRAVAGANITGLPTRHSGYTGAGSTPLGDALYYLWGQSVPAPPEAQTSSSLGPMTTYLPL